MLNWQHIIFRSFYYIGLLSPFVFITCYVIICILQYLKRKSERNQEISKLGNKYKRKNKTKYASFTDVTSDNSTQSLCINEEDTNQYLYRVNENHPEMNNSEGDSIEGSSINIPEADTCEDLSENETYVFEERLDPQNENNDFHKEFISSKLSKSARNTQSKCKDRQQNTIYDYNTKRKQLMFNNGDNKSYAILSSATKQDPPIGNQTFDDKSLTTDPVEAVCKINQHKDRICDGEFEAYSPNIVSSNKLENHSLIKKSQLCGCGLKNKQEYLVIPINESLLHEIHEKCPICPISREEKVTPEIQARECFPDGIYNAQEISKHHKNSRIPVFQNSNIPIAKRVLEDDQFYDLRQKFYSAENPFLSPPKFMKTRYNTINKNNKQIHQFHKKSCPLKNKYFEEGNVKDFGTQYPEQTAHVTEEIGNENQTENVSSTCDSSGKEELVCNYWKSLKTEMISQKRNKAVQTEIPSPRQSNTELFLQKHVNEINGIPKQKYQETIPYIQTKQDVTKQAHGTIAKKDTLSTTKNQSTQTNVNKTSYTLRELPQTTITEHQPKVWPLSTQVPHDTKNTDTCRTCKNCQIFLPAADYSEENITTNTTKPVIIYPRPIQAEFQNSCNDHFQSDCTQLIENTGNIQYCSNCLRSNFTMNRGNMFNKYADCDLQNKHNYYAYNPVMPVNYFENSQHLNSCNKARERQIQKPFIEGNMPINDNFAQYGRHDENKYKTHTMENKFHQQNEHSHESSNKMPVTTHQHFLSNYSTKDFGNQTNTWKNENAISQGNEPHIDTQNEGNLIQPLLRNYRNNRSKLHDVAEIDAKATQTSEKALISPNQVKEHSKQTSKDVVKKSNSHTEINTEQALEKSNAQQIHAKENVLKQIKRMYSHMDPSTHEKNENVTTEVQKVLKMKGMWHSENK